MIRTRVRPYHGTRHRARPDPDKVIRVPLGPRRRTYAYLCRGAVLGDLVRVRAPLSGTVVVPVVGYGRGGYSGPLKRAHLLHGRH